MKLTHKKLEKQLVFETGKAVEWIIESPVSFSMYVQQLYEQIHGAEGEFILSDDDKILNMEKTTEMIIDPFLLDFQNRQIQKTLYAELCELAINSELFQQTQAIRTDLQKYFIDLEYASQYDLKIDENIDIMAIFKAAGARLDCGDEETLFERLVSYMKVLAELLKKKLVILVNSQSYLTEEQLDQIIEFCMYHELSLLVIESVQRGFSEKRSYCIIDRDECCVC